MSSTPTVEPAGPGMHMPVSGSPPDFPQVMGHPRPLWMLFMTEFWERFAFYGMRWALVLYIVAQFYQGSGAGEGDETRGRALRRPAAGSVHQTPLCICSKIIRYCSMPPPSVSE